MKPDTTIQITPRGSLRNAHFTAALCIPNNTGGSMKLFELLYVLLCAILMPVAPIYAQENLAKNEIIKSIEAKVSAIEGFEKKNPKRLKIFEATEKNKGVKINELLEMPKYVPEDSIFMVYVLHNEEGKVLKHQVDPTSESGDWSASFTHYFDGPGRTIMFEFYSGAFNSGCTEILKIRRKYYYDDNFNLIKKTVAYSDGDNKPIKNIAKCDTYGIQRDEPKIYRTYKDIEGQINKSTTPYIQ